MPIYEFYSPDSHRIYSFLARSGIKGGEQPLCPDGPKKRMEKVVSAFAYTRKAKEVVRPEGKGEPVMDARMEREMMSMADEFSKMDEKNPDPRVMGKMMRRMMEASGQKLPSEMGEMLQRLEKGENPDKLEEEYGEVMEKMEGLEGPAGEKGENWRMRLRRKMPPRRDPKLYEWQDYLPKKKRGAGRVRQKA